MKKSLEEQKNLETQLKINQRLELENKKIQEANRLKSEFLANMSHELRTPLNAIIGFSELLFYKDFGPLSEEQEEAVGYVITSAKDLMRIINDLLDLSKVESGKMEFYPQTINLRTLVEEVTENVKAWSQKKRVALTYRVDNEVSEAYLDPARFKQILYNFLSNALKFTSDFGSIKISITSEQPSTFRLSVEDNGIGIAAEDINKIFTEFTQLDSSPRRKYPGTGLGLSLTKQIVEAQGGEIGVLSTLGKGSHFYAILPRHYPHEKSSSANHEQGASASPTMAKKLKNTRGTL